MYKFKVKNVKAFAKIFRPAWREWYEIAEYEHLVKDYGFFWFIFDIYTNKTGHTYMHYYADQSKYIGDIT